jgi:hypothetical protein
MSLIKRRDDHRCGPWDPRRELDSTIQREAGDQLPHSRYVMLEAALQQGAALVILDGAKGNDNSEK